MSESINNWRKWTELWLIRRKGSQWSGLCNLWKKKEKWKLSSKGFKCVCAGNTVAFLLDFTGVSFKVLCLQLFPIQEIPIHILKNGHVISHRQIKYSLPLKSGLAKEELQFPSYFSKEQTGKSISAANQRTKVSTALCFQS